MPSPDDPHESLGQRVRRLWYRYALGLSPTQTQWRLDRLRDSAARPRSVTENTLLDPRFRCVCGQLMVRSDRTCSSCGRRSLMPFWVRVLGRVGADLMPSTSPATHLLLALMGLGYVMQMRAGGGGLFSPVPFAGYLLDLGAASPPLTLGEQPWRAVTYQFLHGGALHLLMNCVNLLQVGPLIEGHFGSARTLLGFLVTGALGVIMPPLLGFGGLAPTVGASGALFGLMGMAWLASRGVADAQTRAVHASVQRWIIYALVFSFAFGFAAGGRIAHGAHIGGLLAGVAIVWFMPPPLGQPGRRRVTPLFGLAAVGLLVASLYGFFSWRLDGAPQKLTGTELDMFWLQSRLAHEDAAGQR